VNDDTRPGTVELSPTTWSALQAESDRTGETISSVADRIITAGLAGRGHSLFQVSTTTALVKGVFSGATTVGELQRHGNFGLGTFEGLDGELIMVDGDCFRASAGGMISVAPPDGTVPFAVVTRFVADARSRLSDVGSLDEFGHRIDEWRPSENLFVAIRGDGHFVNLSMRAACRARPGEDLVAATGHQSEFTVSGVDGVLVGFWTPPYAQAINVPGYHFHFLAEDRSLGGHVLDLVVDELEVALHLESDVHVALPDTSEFLAADLRGDTAEALDIAESSRE
jgi:acetolactate decarboxylase